MNLNITTMIGSNRRDVKIHHYYKTFYSRNDMSRGLYLLLILCYFRIIYSFFKNSKNIKS